MKHTDENVKQKNHTLVIILHHMGIYVVQTNAAWHS